MRPQASAEERTRTSTSLRTHEPESCASANSATSAEEGARYRLPFTLSSQVRRRPLAGRASALRASRLREPSPASIGDNGPHRPSPARLGGRVGPEHGGWEHRASFRAPQGSLQCPLARARTASPRVAKRVFLPVFASRPEHRSILKIGPVFGVQCVRNLQLLRF
jgi:hypothetical protein